MPRVSSSVLVLLILYIRGCTPLDCPNGLQFFPPGSCVSLSPGLRSECDSRTAGLAVLSESQLSPGGILSTYAAAVLDSDQLMWLGYSYNSGGDLIQDGQGLTGLVEFSVLNDNANFDLKMSISPESGVCVAINRNGTFVRRECSETVQWSLCQINMHPFTISLPAVIGPSTVSEGSSVTLTCQTFVPNATVSWLAVFGSDPPTTLPSTTSSYTIDSYSENIHSGWYFCALSEPSRGFVSAPFSLSTTGSPNGFTSVPVQTQPAQIRYYDAANITCSVGQPGAASRVLWFVDGSPVSGSELVLRVDSVQQQGFYGCAALTPTTSYYGALYILPEASVASVVDVVSVEPMSRSSLSVQWLCPEAVGTHDPVLLTYQVTYYSSSSSTQSVVSVRAAHAMQDKNSCLLRTVLEGLEEGTSYSVKVRAMAGSVQGADSGIISQAATFGQAPGPVLNLEVSRSTDKKVQAKWDKVETTPPVGMVAEYHIEYRQYTKKSVSSIRNFPDQTTVVISNVIEDDSYEIRVRAGVLSSRNPDTINYGPFTKWERVGGKEAITTEGILPQRSNRAGEITTGVVIGIAAGIAIIAVLIAIVALFVGRQS